MKFSADAALQAAATIAAARLETHTSLLLAGQLGKGAPVLLDVGQILTESMRAVAAAITRLETDPSAEAMVLRAKFQ
jgi:hypothetical protein